jgi:polyisoprenoid-binding protein YceI
MKTALAAVTALAVLALAFGTCCAAAQERVLICDPAQTRADFTLSASFHTVEGDFKLKRGEIRFDPASGKIGGQIVFDATSGQTGNGSRDKKMHRDVLQSERYPEISFHPDRFVGHLTTGQPNTSAANSAEVTPGGDPVQPPSTVQVHGVFAIHGSEHEITVPVEVNLERTQWTATAHFHVPYVEWGMKNPSNLFLHVADTVDVVLHAAGDVRSRD